MRDFDLNFGLHNLRSAPSKPPLRVWVSPLWQNLVFLCFLAAIILSFVSVLYNPEIEWRSTSRLMAVLVGASALFFLFAVLVMGAGALHRARLVLDRDDRSLLFYRSLLWPRVTWRLKLDQIKSADLRKVDEPAVGSDDVPWTYQIIVAELKDGRLASIAFDSDYDILTAIRDEISR